MPRKPAAEARWLRASPETGAMVPAEAAGEPDEEADSELAELVKYNLRTVEAIFCGRIFSVSGVPVSRLGGSSFCTSGATRVMRSRIEPMKKVARMLRSHRRIDPELVPGPWRRFPREL